MFCWGGGTEGQLGLGQMVQAQVKPRQVGDLDFVAIAAGQEWKQQQRSSSDKAMGSANEGNDADEPALGQNLSQQPTITKVFAGPMYSAAVSSSGHVYTWGSNDAGQAGIPTPAFLPIKDNLNNPGVLAKTSTARERHCCTFDSEHNILLPVRVDAARSMFVSDMVGGPNHLWLLGSERTAEQDDMFVGRTLYEVQEELRIEKLHRARHSLLSKVQGAGIDDGWTEDLTTQTENEETTQEEANPVNYQYDLSMSPIIISDAITAEVADTSKVHDSASANPLMQDGRSLATIPSIIHEINAGSGYFATLTPSPTTPSRRRFSLPRMLNRLSLGKHKTPPSPEPSVQQQEAGRKNNSLTKRKSKRNSL